MSSRARRRSLAIAVVVSFSLAISVASMFPTRSHARTLPVHCGEILDGNCESPLYCLYLCFMELREQMEFCALYPTDPRCQ
jgi:hypothetical protein